jgi:hypothetical protein
VNFGFLNSTISDPIMDYGVDKLSQGVTAIARALEGAGLLGDLATGPSGESIVDAAAIEAFRVAAVNAFNNRTTWFIGVGSRGADLEVYNNGETILNFSGAKIRLDGGEGPGGSGLGSSSFVFDAGALSQGLSLDPNRLLATNDSTAQRLGGILFRAYSAGGHSEQNAYEWTAATYQNGGKAALAERAREVLGVNTPNSVNDRAFVRIGRAMHESW